MLIYKIKMEDLLIDNQKIDKPNLLIGIISIAILVILISVSFFLSKGTEISAP